MISKNSRSTSYLGVGGIERRLGLIWAANHSLLRSSPLTPGLETLTPPAKSLKILPLLHAMKCADAASTRRSSASFFTQPPPELEAVGLLVS